MIGTLSPVHSKALSALRTDGTLALCPPSDVSHERGSSTRRRPLGWGTGGHEGGRKEQVVARDPVPGPPQRLVRCHESCDGPLSPSVSPSHFSWWTLGTCHSPWDPSRPGSHGLNRGPCVRLWWEAASAPLAVSEAPLCPAKGGERAPRPGAGDSRGLAHGSLGTGPSAHGAAKDEMSCALTATSHCGQSP